MTPENLEILFYQYFKQECKTVIQLRGDGSDRRVYRLINENFSVIGVIGKDKAEDEAFVSFTQHFHKNGLPVPEIFIADLNKNIYLEKDLGDLTLAEFVQENTNDISKLAKIYRVVLENLTHFQITAGKSINLKKCYQHPVFAYDSMMWDLHYFEQRFLNAFYKEKFDINELHKEFEVLVAHLQEENANYFMYRDFQSRNIMIQKDSPWFLDYQSGRKGALAYDVASLLYDPYVDLTEDFRSEMLNHYLNYTNQFIAISKDRFLGYFPGFAFIRMLQALAAYGFLSVIKGKKEFLSSIKPAVNNLVIIINNVAVKNELTELEKIIHNLGKYNFDF